MTEVKALIFDLDGVLVNTIDLHYRAWKYLADQFAIPFSPADIERFRGIQRQQFIRELFAPNTLTFHQVEQYALIKDRIFMQELEKTSIDAIRASNAENLILQAKTAGLRIGVASSSANASLMLKHTALYHLIDVVADGKTVNRSKPAPDIFVWTAGALGVRPQEVIVFEDALAGILAAKTAGMFVVGLGNPEGLHHAHLVTATLNDVTLDTVLETARNYHLTEFEASTIA